MLNMNVSGKGHLVVLGPGKDDYWSMLAAALSYKGVEFASSYVIGPVTLFSLAKKVILVYQCIILLLLCCGDCM